MSEPLIRVYYMDDNYNIIGPSPAPGASSRYHLCIGGHCPPGWLWRRGGLAGVKRAGHKLSDLEAAQAICPQPAIEFNP